MQTVAADFFTGLGGFLGDHVHSQWGNNVAVHVSTGAGVPYRELIMVGMIGAFVSYLATSVIRILATDLGAVALPRERDVHLIPTPRWGGAAIYLGFLTAVVVASQLPALARGFMFSAEMPAVLVSGLMIVILGLIDDRWGLNAPAKLAGQIASAGILVRMGVSWYLFFIPWGVGTVVLDNVASGLLTVVIVVTLVNTINFLDGLDGLVAGIGFISALGIALFSMGLLRNEGGDSSYYPPALIAIALAGACLGFLPHNFNPARIFMGDTGAMFIGLVLATAATSASGRVSLTSYGFADLATVLSPLLLALSVMLIPVVDIIIVVINRWRRGEKFYHADKTHVQHRLLNLGHSHRQAVLLIYLWVGLLVFAQVAQSVFSTVWAVLFFSVGFVIALVATFGSRLHKLGSHRDQR